MDCKGVKGLRFYKDDENYVRVVNKENVPFDPVSDTRKMQAPTKPSRKSLSQSNYNKNATASNKQNASKSFGISQMFDLASIPSFLKANSQEYYQYSTEINQCSNCCKNIMQNNEQRTGQDDGFSSDFSPELSSSKSHNNVPVIAVTITGPVYLTVRGSAENLFQSISTSSEDYQLGSNSEKVDGMSKSHDLAEKIRKRCSHDRPGTAKTKIPTSLIDDLQSVTSCSGSGDKGKCVRCGGNVYHAERMLVGNQSYHSCCYRCLICGVRLSSLSVNIKNCGIYCKSCYNKAYGMRGYKYSPSPIVVTKI